MNFLKNCFPNTLNSLFRLREPVICGKSRTPLLDKPFSKMNFTFTAPCLASKLWNKIRVVRFQNLADTPLN